MLDFKSSLEGAVLSMAILAKIVVAIRVFLLSRYDKQTYMLSLLFLESRIISVGKGY